MEHYERELPEPVAGRYLYHFIGSRCVIYFGVKDGDTVTWSWRGDIPARKYREIKFGYVGIN